MSISNVDVDFLKRRHAIDRDWYISTYGLSLDGQSDVEMHFLTVGTELGYSPGPNFDVKFYNDVHRDVLQSGINPYLHFLRFGRVEGRRFRPLLTDRTWSFITASEYVLTKDEVEDLKRSTRGIVAGTSIFDEDWYRLRYAQELKDQPDVRLHYIQFGASKGFDPGPTFSTTYYRESVTQVKAHGLNPLAHYVRYGSKLGVNPNRNFHATWYAERYGVEPADALMDYVGSDSAQGKSTAPWLSGEWIEQSAQFRLGDYKHALHFLQSGPLDAQTRTRIDKYGLTRPTRLKEFLDDGLIFEAEDVPVELYRMAVDQRSDLHVSIIMPTWNRQGVICRAIDSALAQTFRRFELIVVDDGSTDETVSMLHKRYAAEIESGLIKLVVQENKGVCAARNAGLDAATGNVIAYLDSDNKWRPEALELMLAGLCATPDTDAAYAAAMVNDDVGGIRRIVGQRFDRRALLRSNFIDLNTFVHKAECQGVRPRFDESLTRLVDWELIIRITREIDPAFVPAVVVDYFIDSELNNITYSEPLEDNLREIQSRHRAEFLRNALVSPIDFAVRYVAEDASSAVQKEVPEGQARLPVKFAVIIDSDTIDSFVTEQLDALRRIGQIYIRHDESYRPLGSRKKKNVSSFDDLVETIFYWPTAGSRMLRFTSVLAAVMAIGINDLDIAIVSHHKHGADGNGRVALRSLRDQVLVSRSAARTWLSSLSLPSMISGRLLRLETERLGIKPQLSPVSDVLGHRVTFDGAGQSFWTEGSNAAQVTALKFEKANFPKLASPLASVVILAMKTSIGGVERLSQNLARAWKGKYNCIYLALEPTAADQGDITEELDDDGTIVIPGGEIASHNQRASLLRVLQDSYDPRAIYIMNGSSWLINNAATFRRVFKKAVIVDQQAYDHQEGWINHYLKPSVRSFDRFVAINDRIHETLISKFRLPADRVVLVPHGHDMTSAIHMLDKLSREDACAAFGVDPRKKNIVFAGRLVDQKRPFSVLDLAKRRLDRTDEHFIIVGDGALAKACRDRISKESLTNVTMVGHVKEVAKVYRAADALLVTSAYEGLPLVLVEAIGMGLPVLATDVGQIRETVERFDAGIASATCDDLRLLDAQLTVLLHDLGRYGRKVQEARSYFAIDRMAERYEAAGSLKESI